MAGYSHDVIGELEQKLTQTIGQRFTELTFVNGLDIPTTFDLEPGVDAVSVDIITSYGQAKLLSREAADIPLVVVNITKDKAPVVMAVAGYGMGFQAERSYSYSGKSALISDRSVLAVRRVIDERLHYFAAYGDPSVGATGFFNHPSITPVSVSAATLDPAEVPASTNNTYAKWLEFFMSLVTGMGLGSYGLSIPTDILISRGMMARLATVTDPQSASTSALMAIRARLDAMGETYANIRIEARPECDGATLLAKGVRADATKDRVVVYRKDPMVIARQMEASIAQMMPEKYSFSAGDGRIIYPMFSTASATQIYETSSIRYYDLNAAPIPA